MLVGRLVLLPATLTLMAAVLLVSCQKDGMPASNRTASVESASPAKESMPTSTHTAAVESVSLQDVQTLFGGQNLWLSSNGKVIAQVVEPGLKEKRYELTLASDEVAELEQLLAKHDFAKIQLKERSGRPDEARPTISVTTADEKTTEVAKWAGDAHPGFDAIYAQLMAIVDRAKKANQLLYEGKFDHNWRPAGWR
jgi:hypothetical protein